MVVEFLVVVGQNKKKMIDGCELVSEVVGLVVSKGKMMLDYLWWIFVSFVCFSHFE